MGRVVPAAALLLALSACGESATLATPRAGGAPLRAAAANGIDGEYVVVLREGADPTAVAALAGVHPRHVYTAAVNGFAAPLNRGQLAALRHHPAVEFVEQDQLHVAMQSGVPWNLDRIDQRYLPLDGRYNVNTTASNVTAYVIDTGIRTNHTQVGTRAAVAYDALGGNGQDCNGHGTHVAGVIGGSTYGVAKGVRLRAVRVLNCNGSGSTSGIIAGVDWVRVNRVRPAVANLSIGGGFSSALNTGVNNMANPGVYTAVASGSSNANACNYSPASASQVTTAAASNQSDQRVTSGNYGSCVHLYAPGAGIVSAWHTSTTATQTLSGSSLAAPHVAGVGALYLAYYPSAANTTVRSWIINNATVGGGGGGAPRAHNAWGTQSPDFLNWGTPFAGHCADDRTGAGRNFCPVGNTMPDYTVSLQSTLDWRGFSLYGLLEAVQGIDVYNQPLQWSVFRDNVSLFDQSAVSENERKPIGYWRALYGGLGGLVPNGEFVEDGSFVKLRELSLRYGFGAEQLSRVPGLSGFSGLALSVSGRNLMTWSDYRGYDPEVGRAGGATGSAALARVDGYNYPNFRTWTFGAELSF
jgi:hypothetical protein